MNANRRRLAMAAISLQLVSVDRLAAAATGPDSLVPTDNSEEFIKTLTKFCGAKVWVLFPDGDSLRVLLTASRDQEFRVLSTARRGHPDLELSAGTLTWTVDGMASAVGQAVFIPRGAVHRFDNLDTEDAKQLSIVTLEARARGTFEWAQEP